MDDHGQNVSSKPSNPPISFRPLRSAFCLLPLNGGQCLRFLSAFYLHRSAFRVLPFAFRLLPFIYATIDRVRSLISGKPLTGARRILLTSFATWQAHQRHNSSDQLLAEINQFPEASSLYFFRQLPVNLPVARDLTIAKLQQFQPDLLVCCGMAAGRTHLNLEAQAVVSDRALKTEIDLARLAAGLPFTVISENAGRFVCNSLYHAMLDYLNGNFAQCQALFVHVPTLTPANREQIVQDFRQVIQRLQFECF